MQNIEWLKIKEIFHETLDLPESERESFLTTQEDFVRSEVARLLETHEKLEDFIAEPLALEIGLDANSYIGQTIGSYKILALLGAGGMGQVFLGEKAGFDKKIALKLIKRGMDTDSILKRFVRERRILARLENPFIASLLDAGSTENGQPFLVMEFVDGLPLTKFCDEHQFDTKECLEIFQKVCEAVKHAHQNLIVHRDIKPSNILVTADGTPKLLDFGIAKLLGTDDFENATTAMQSRLFTPEYASPEQINGLPVTTATDVYSLGVVLYELLSGVRPFNSKNKSYREVANLVLTEEPVRPSSVVSGQWSVVSETEKANGHITNDEGKKINPKSKIQNPKSFRGDLDNIILKSLRKEPERRYQSVQEFAEDIRRYLVGLPVTATADSSVYRFRKFIGRNKFGTAVASIILLLSLFSGWQAVVATRERELADERFRQVRKLANAVLFEYQDAIQKLPGSTAIREKMVADGAEYLDKLAAENSSDPGLQIELAKAFDRLGDVKGNFITASVGNSLAAKEFYTKALRIKEKLLMENPEHPDYPEQIAISYDKLGDMEFGLGNQKISIEYYQKAVKMREQILQNGDRQDVRFRLMKGYRNIAVRGRNDENTEENLTLCRRALGMSEELLREAPLNAEYLEGYGDVIEGLAAILETNLTRRPEAVEAYRKLIEIRREHSAKYPNNLPLRQKYGMSYSYLGDTFFELKNLPNAIESYRKSLDILDPLGLQDPLNEPLIQDTANIRSSYAYSLAVTGNTTESFFSLESVIRIFEGKYAKDQTDRTTHFRIAMAKEGFAITHNNIANLPNKTEAERLAALEKAISNFEESLEIYKVYQTGDRSFPSINVNVDIAIAEVTRALENCRKELKKIADK